jgi:CRP-like cAMP-binding protein
MQSVPALAEQLIGLERSVAGRCRIGPQRPVERRTVGNQLLLGLDPAEFRALAPKLSRVSLRPRQILVERYVPIREVFFIERGLASVTYRTRQERGLEISMVGCMGVTGLAAVLGTATSPFRCIVHTPGVAIRISTPDLRNAIEKLPHLRQRLMNYVQARMAQQAQITVCNSRHRVMARVARWLLLGLDRLHGNTLPVTHDLLGRMLGVRRAGVSVVLQEFERRGIVRRGRGELTVLDRAALELCTCDCYRLIRREYDRLIGADTSLGGACGQRTGIVPD